MRFERIFFSVKRKLVTFLPVKGQPVKLEDTVLLTKSAASEGRTFFGVFVRRKFYDDVRSEGDFDRRFFVDLEFERRKLRHLERNRHVQRRHFDRRQNVAVLRMNCRELNRRKNDFHKNQIWNAFSLMHLVACWRSCDTFFGTGAHEGWRGFKIGPPQKIFSKNLLIKIPKWCRLTLFKFGPFAQTFLKIFIYPTPVFSTRVQLCWLVFQVKTKISFNLRHTWNYFTFASELFSLRSKFFNVSTDE